MADGNDYTIEPVDDPFIDDGGGGGDSSSSDDGGSSGSSTGGSGDSDTETIEPANDPEDTVDVEPKTVPDRSNLADQEIQGPERVGAATGVTEEMQENTVEFNTGGGGGGSGGSTTETVSEAEVAQSKNEAEARAQTLENQADFLEEKGRTDKAQELEQRASQSREAAAQFDTAQKRIQELNSRNTTQKNSQIRVNGKTGQPTQQGRKFLEQQERLEDKPTFSLNQESVAGELVKEGVIGQFAEAGETAAETFVTRKAPEPFQPFVRNVAEKNIQDIGGLGVEGTRGKPRQAFRESLPSLGVAQRRSGRFVDQKADEFLTQSQQERLPELATTFASQASTTPGTSGSDFVSETVSGPARSQVEKAFGITPRAAAEEVPEKVVESASVAGAASAGFRDTRRLSRETVEGAGIVARKAAEEPVEFGQGEIGVDVGLDLLTGGGAAVTVPQVKKAGGRLTSAVDPNGNTIGSGAGAFVPQEQARPTSQTQTIEPVTPDQLRPLDSTQFVDRPQTRSTSLSVNTAAGQATGSTGVFSPPETQGLSRPESGVFSNPFSKSSAVPESLTETQSRTESVAESLALPKSASLSLAEPVSEPVSQPVPEIVPNVQPRPRTVTDVEDDGDKGDGLLSELFGRSQDRNVQRSVGADLLGIEDEDLSTEQATNPLSLRGLDENQ